MSILGEHAIPTGRKVVSQMMTMLDAQAWRREKERDKESESSGGAESTLTSVLCLHYDPSGESKRCVDATYTHTGTPAPGEALKYSTQHIRRALGQHIYSCAHTQIYCTQPTCVNKRKIRRCFSFCCQFLEELPSCNSLYVSPLMFSCACASMFICVWACVD